MAGPNISGTRARKEDLERIGVDLDSIEMAKKNIARAECCESGAAKSLCLKHAISHLLDAMAEAQEL